MTGLYWTRYAFLALLLLVAGGLPVVWAFSVFMLALLAPVVYSFVHYKKLEREGAL